MATRLTRYLLFSVLMLGLMGCGRVFTEDEEDIALRTVGLDVSFEIQFGEKVALEEAGLEVSFPLISEDSRCPTGVNCVTLGEAVIVLHLKDADGTLSALNLQIPGLVATPYTSNLKVPHKQYDFRLLRLDPYPRAGIASDEEEYRALLIVQER